MIRINQLKLVPGHTDRELEEKIRRILRLKEKEIFSYEIVKRSLDARKKPELFYSYTVDVCLDSEQRIIKNCKSSQVSMQTPVNYAFPLPGQEDMKYRPVIIGTGPAGLFCGYMLAFHGYRPLLLERGEAVESRQQEVETFWQTGRLNPECNVQFGEGGAGTFSDGKLNTLVKDKYGRNKKVLDIFVEAGAQPDIRYEGKPHIGTDILIKVVKNMREAILRLGGEVRFGAKVTDIRVEDGAIRAVLVKDLKNGGKEEELPAQAVVLAIGHSARDTFEMLFQRKVPMEAKPFAVGLRVEHPQDLINRSQYGKNDPEHLPAASYKLTAQTKEGRSVYSFCMCPGGYVVNASSEQGRLAVNGMSYSGRSGKNGNSAVVVSVTKEDFGGKMPLDGLEFQRELEKRAWNTAQGKVPVEYYGDFKRHVEKQETGKEEKCIKTGLQIKAQEYMPDMEKIMPQIKGKWQFGAVHEIMPQSLNRAFVEGMEQFGHSIHGFSEDHVLLSGIESRTSSPVRIERDENGQSQIRGLYPCGEGAGYAGGITSAAMDGIKMAEWIAGKYRPFMD